MNDSQLLELLRKDPQKGLAEVIKHYSAYVLKIAYTKLGDICTREDIEEAVSDIFLKFYNAGVKRSFDMRSVCAFLSVIAQRHCIDVFRSMSKYDDTYDYDELENIIADNESFDADRLIDAVKQLGEPDSFIFIRKYYFGQRNKDIAKELGMTVSALNSRVSRGLDKLRRILEEESL